MHSLKQLINESTSRYCSFYLASNGKWYLELADREYGEREEANTYGPFSTMDKAIDYLDQFSNPGGWDEDDSGKRPPPTKSPNGRPVQSPGGGGGSMWGGGGFSSSARDYFMGGGRSSSRSSAKMTDQQLSNRISDIIHDYGDEYGWDRKPDVQFVLDDLADQTRKEGWTYDSAAARKFAEQALGVKPKAAPVPAPKPVAKPAVAPAKPPPAPAKPARGGKKATYKIYGAHHDVNLGSSPLHTRIAGKVYAPTAASKFKKGQSAATEVGPDGKLKVTDPETGHTQSWSKKESLERLLHDFIELL